MEEKIKQIFRGDVLSDKNTREAYSHDASLCEVFPEMVLFPRDASDIKSLVRFVSQQKKQNPKLSITVRAAGSCMSGGSLNESIILDVSRYMHGVQSIEKRTATVLPGTYYRDFEVETLKQNLILPCYTASKNLCAIGGMIGNNAAGEKTLRYGKMENYIESLNVVFADGNEYTVSPLNAFELNKKVSEDSFEGRLYKSVKELIEQNKDLIEKEKPKVSKNSAGYYLWNVWDGNTFDLSKLIVGAQGTLGIVTEAKLRLVPVHRGSKLCAIFLRDLSRLSELVNDILSLSPESLESYDDSTLKLAVRFFPEMLKSMKAKNFLKLIWSFLPEAMMIVTGGLPKLILLVEFSSDSEGEIDEKMESLVEKIRPYGYSFHVAHNEEESEKYWTIRRESFNLLRKHVAGKRTAPFVDDVIVDPKHLPVFLPKMRKILDQYKLIYTIAGHAGNGNFHIIPLMDMKDPRNVEVILEVSEKVYDLVKEYGGSITAEHNDGIIRTPYLSKMYSKDMLELFKRVKAIFDPLDIFNPGKKVGGSITYLKNHIRQEQ